MNLTSKFLNWCAGANNTLLASTPTEISKYNAIGVTILFTGIFASLSGGYAMYKVFNNPLVALILGLLWGFMILNLDRLIVMSMKKKKSISKEMLTALPRIVLAIMISIVIVKPLEIRIFQDLITDKIFKDKLYSLNQSKQSIYEYTEKNKYETLEITNNKAILNLKNELEKECPTTECQEASRKVKESEEKFLNLKRRLQPIINNADKNIQFIKNTDKYKEIIILDSTEKKRLTKEGEKLLRRFRGIFNSNVEKRQSAENDFINSKKNYESIKNNYTKEKKNELEAAKKYGKEISSAKKQKDEEASKLVADSEDSSNKAYTDNFISQIKALGRLTSWKDSEKDEEGNIQKANNTLFWTNIAIVILFIIIETAPIFVKLISPKGQYEISLEAVAASDEAKITNMYNMQIYQSEKNEELAFYEREEKNRIEIELLKELYKNWGDKKKSQIRNANDEDDFRKLRSQILNSKMWEHGEEE